MNVQVQQNRSVCRERLTGWKTRGLQLCPHVLPLHRCFMHTVTSLISPIAGTDRKIRRPPRTWALQAMRRNPHSCEISLGKGPLRPGYTMRFFRPCSACCRFLRHIGSRNEVQLIAQAGASYTGARRPKSRMSRIVRTCRCR